MAEEPCAEGLQDFDSLVRQNRPRIFRFLIASLRDKEAAENLTQDCFVRAYRARDQFRGGSSPGTWLMHIAANLVRDHETNSRLKFWKRRLRSDVDLKDISDWIPDQQKSPEALAELFCVVSLGMGGNCLDCDRLLGDTLLFVVGGT
jgi:RNA polymerase sigma-70 factor (ECF subfamily)